MMYEIRLRDGKFGVFNDEAIKKFHKATKQGGFNGAKIL